MDLSDKVEQRNESLEESGETQYLTDIQKSLGSIKTDFNIQNPQIQQIYSDINSIGNI